MKKLYTPERKNAIEILKIAGFVNANRGYVLFRKIPERSRPTQIHALVELNGDIDLHEDFVCDGKHIARRTSNRLNRFVDILREIDLDLPSSMGRKLHGNYRWSQNYIPIHKIML